MQSNRTVRRNLHLSLPDRVFVRHLRYALLFAAVGIAIASITILLVLALPLGGQTPVDLLVDARQKEEVRMFVGTYPNSTEYIQTEGAIASAFFVSNYSMETCTDEFCSNIRVVTPFLRVVYDTTLRDEGIIYCGVGTIDENERIQIVREFRPFDEDLCLSRG
jgi:hypothetical protein